MHVTTLTNTTIEFNISMESLSELSIFTCQGHISVKLYNEGLVTDWSAKANYRTWFETFKVQVKYIFVNVQNYV